MFKSGRSIFSKIQSGINGCFNTALQGTHNHYLTYLPEKIGFFSSFLLNMLFAGIKTNKEQKATLEELKKDGIIIYATKYKSYFEFLFHYTRLKQEGLPFPEIGFDYKVVMWQPAMRIFRILLSRIDYFLRHFSLQDPYKSGYIKEELLNGRSGLLSLIEKRGFYRRFVKSETDPVRYLIETQNSTDHTVYIVPQLIFFSNEPERYTPNLIDIIFGSKEKPGKLRRLFILFNSPKKILVENSEPVNLKKFLNQDKIQKQSIEQQAISLRLHLILQINRRRQSITGPILKSRMEIKQNILTNSHLQNYMANYANKRDVPTRQVHKEAAEYFEEIAANYSTKWIKIYDILLTWVLTHIFEGMMVDKDGLTKVKRISHKGPIIYVPCHKSHLDYLILSYILFHNNMPCPHIAAGMNLSFWPLGSIFRGGGAFFLRRTFRGAELYSKVFSSYVEKLLSEGFNIEFFIEGGRSRTGKMLMPKFGFLSILLNAYHNGACDDLIFVPVNIGYDRILEERSYMHEVKGGQKEDENVRQVIKARKFLKKRYGKVYVNFHEPISLNALIHQNDYQNPEDAKNDTRNLCRNLGDRITNSINRVSVVTPYGLVSSAVLNCSKLRFSYKQLMDHLKTYMNYLSAQNIRLADTLILDHPSAFNNVLENFVQRKFIEQHSTDGNKFNTESTFKINENSRQNLDYYKNNCITFFIPAAFTSLAILEKDAFLFSAQDLLPCYTFLEDLFSNEFAPEVDREPEYFIRKNIKAFIDDAMIIPHPALPDTYNLTAAGFRKLKFFSNYLKPYFESYSVVLSFLAQLSKDSSTSKDRIKKIQSHGNHMYKINEINRKEALSKISFINAYTFFTSHGVKNAEHTEKLNYYSNRIQKFLNFLPN